jgi:hypothetical protein
MTVANVEIVGEYPLMATGATAYRIKLIVTLRRHSLFQTLNQLVIELDRAR